MEENKMGTIPVSRLVISMALPLMLSLLINSLYNFVDSVFVARVSEDALTAISLAAPMQLIVSSLCLGNAVGLNAVISRALGEKNQKKVKDAASAALFLAFCSWILNSILCIAFARIYFESQSGGNEAIAAYGIQYLSICMIASLGQMGQWVFDRFVMASGKAHLFIFTLSAASLTNLILDPIFIFGWFGLPRMETAGAALATVTAQAFSALYCFMVVRKIDIVHTSKEDFETVPGLNRKLLGLGAPILFQDVIISVGGLAVQFVIIGYGFLFVAGFTATNKLYGVLEMAAISYGYAVVSYVGQNLGAGKIDRIKKGIHTSAFLAFLTSAFISIMMFLFGKFLLSMFISGDPTQAEQVLGIAWHYLSIMASCLCILYFLYVYRSALQGLGNTMLPMLSGVVEFFVRVGVALLLPQFIGQNGIFYAEIAAWTGATVLLVVSYYISIRKFM